jgi:FlaA1/EpsC-like NDP-sugar epimerase
MDEEGIRKTENKKIFIGKANNVTMPEIEPSLDALRCIAESENQSAVHEAIMQLVETYKRTM